MVRKRFRVRGSRNCGDIGVLNQRQFSEMPADVRNQSHRGILSLSSPPICYEEERGSQLQYLDNCYQCRKKIELSQDIYMYRDFAFCGVECRDAKIAIDIEAEDPKQSRVRN